MPAGAPFPIMGTGQGLVCPFGQKKVLSMDDARAEARDLLRKQKIQLWELWVVYWGQGGSLDLFGFDAYIQGLIPGTEFDQNALQWALQDLSRLN